MGSSASKASRSAPRTNGAVGTRTDLPSPRRCAIYTRVSSDSGLEQDFNSLDNQREACEAYIKSQTHEGWILTRDRFDDGGFSGGSMDRPALQKLLDDVRLRRVDVIVVYKVDRLTRSLADFAKLVELFDQHGVSFISVTQSFNTTTSMGRLTLNVLLSFAQFEREVTAERIRDKVAASKRKGIWMGGSVPLGYRAENRALHVVEVEAEFVRMLFRRYLELGSVVRLKAVLDQEKVTSPVRKSRAGRSTGGTSMSRGHLYWILSNPIYHGRLRHKGQVHEGLHPPIIDPQVFADVGRRLQAQTQLRRQASPDEHSILAGKLYDDRGHLMGASSAAKGAKRWRYYVSRATLTGNKTEAGSLSRVSAPEIERQVMSFMKDHLSDHSLSEGQLLAAIDRIVLSATKIEIRLNEAAMDDGADRVVIGNWAPETSRRRRDIIQAEGPEPSIQRTMRAGARTNFIKAMSEARRWLEELQKRPDCTIEAIAKREGRGVRSVRAVLSLAFLSPPLAAAAIEGRLPRGFSVKRLTDLPMLWSEQWRAIGLKAPTEFDLQPVQTGPFEPANLIERFPMTECRMAGDKD
jgi:DNA invertase Pin-like site-specific DNA recombinase